MPNPVRVSVIGCGHLGTFHARLYREIPEAELVRVVDIVPEKARMLGEDLGVPWTTDRALALEESEAVSVATPTTTHAAITLDALARGAHVLVEKPLATSVPEGEAMVRAAEDRERVLAVGHVERFNPAFRAARPLIGHPRFVESHRLSTFVSRSLDIDVVLDLMIHDLDLTLSLISSPLESIDAVGVPVLTAGEDIANARLRFADGAVANLTASRVSRERVRKIRLFGARRYVSVDLMERKVEQVRLEAWTAGTEGAAGTDGAGEGNASRAKPPESATEEEALLAHLRERGLMLAAGSLPVPEANPLRDELADFIAAARGAPLLGASGRDGLRSLAAALEVRSKVRESLTRVDLPGSVAGTTRVRPPDPGRETLRRTPPVR